MRRAVSVDRATLFVAHHLPTVIPADEILIPVNGGAMKCGRQRPFVTHNEQHAVMWRRQQAVGICEARLAVAGSA